MATKRKTDVAPRQSDTEKKRELYLKLRSWFELEHMRQQVNRYQKKQ